MPEISRRVSHEATKMYISYKKSQSSKALSLVLTKQKLRQNARKLKKLKVSSRKYRWTKESPTEPYALARRQASKNK
jgi:mannose-6-phosphate isomerase class I